MDAATRLVPVDDDRDTAGFWEAARRHELVVRACDHCGTVLHLPRAYCHTCGSWDGHWQVVTGHGHLYSWTTVEHQVHPAYPVPYTIVLVELDDAAGDAACRLASGRAAPRGGATDDSVVRRA